MNYAIWFLAAQAALEYGQAAVDIHWTGNLTRAIVMICAGTSSIAMMFMK